MTSKLLYFNFNHLEAIFLFDQYLPCRVYFEAIRSILNTFNHIFLKFCHFLKLKDHIAYKSRAYVLSFSQITSVAIGYRQLSLLRI
jgi:hypothetical protein